MERLYFSARDIRDYLAMLIDTSELNKLPAFPPNYRPITAAPQVKHFLFELMNIYEHRDSGCASPISGETGVEGLRLDFNFGLRLDVPKGNFHVRIGDADSGMIFLDENLSDVRLISLEKYFIRWKVEVTLDGATVLSHTLDLAGQPVLITFKRTAALGDTLAFLPAIAEFKRIHRCRLSVLLPEYLRGVVAELYPDLEQINAMHFDSYATYSYEMYGGNFPFCADMRDTPLERVASFILGVNTLPVKPTFKPTAPRPIADPYVCIGVQASSAIKGWLYPKGWEVVVDYLKRRGYRVLCIDKHAAQTDRGITIRKPANAEDFTGDFTLTERANMLYHADFFIGLSSGLSWLANAVGCPVVMICGFSKDWFEFHTPYRVANRLVCNGCLNDLRVKFFKEGCPYHWGTPRALECQRKISSQQVIAAIERLLADKKFCPNP